jgi:NAD(P)-dependent dehydrogenase (short-subunit alcohol dehydrogenase family)
MTGISQPLANRVAIVTGAGKGLGRAYAQHLASLGAMVVVNNRTANDPEGSSSADRVVDSIRQQGGEAIANYSSVEDPDSGNQLVACAMQHYGRLDIVLSNAGIDRAGSFHKLQIADFETVMEVNFMSVARLLHAAWPRMRQARYGRILVSTSTAGLYGNFGQLAYSSSKAALLGLVKTLALEGAAHDLHINAIAPYAVTQLTRSAFPAQQVEDFSAEAVAPLAAWLLGERCPLSGKTLISGAGQVRMADTLESETVCLGENIASAIATLSQKTMTHTPRSASEEFESFYRSI